MAGQIVHQRRIRPASSARAGEQKEFFYPNEVVALLKIGRIDYRQLRELLALVRGLDGPRDLGKGWARFSLADVAGLQVALALCGSNEPSNRRRYLRISPLVQACRALRSLGYDNPLLEVPLARHGNRVVAQIRGVLMDPQSGQLLLGTTYDLLTDSLSGTPGEAEAKDRLRSELASLSREQRSNRHIPELRTFVEGVSLTAWRSSQKAELPSGSNV